MTEICQVYGWTYDQYLDQPLWFVELIVERMKIDAKKQQNSNSGQMKR